MPETTQPQPQPPQIQPTPTQQPQPEPQWNNLFDEVHQQALTREQNPQPQGQPVVRQRPDKQKAAAQAEQDGGIEKPLGVTDYAMDAVEGVGAGAEGFVRSIGKLGSDIYGALGGTVSDDAHEWDNKVFKTKTWLGGMVSGITQFALGFLPALGPAGMLGEAAGLTGTALKIGSSLAAGAVADFAGFRDDQQRLSDLINEFPTLKNPVTEFLGSDKSDGFLTGRLKNAIEGLGLGAAGELLMPALQGFKGKLSAFSAADPQLYKEAAEKAATEIAPIAKKVLGKDADVLAHPELQQSTYKPRTIRDVMQGIDRKPWEGMPQELAKTTADFVKRGMPEDQAISEAVKTHMNMERIESPEDLKRFGKYANAAADEWVQGNNPAENLKFVQAQAKEMADVMGQDPRLLWNSVAADASNVTDMAKRLAAYRMNREGLGQTIQKFATAIMSSGFSDADKDKALAGALKEYLSLHNGVQYIQKEMARGPSYGRIGAQPNVYNMDYLAKQAFSLLDGDGGKKAKEQFVRALAGAQDDPKAMFNTLTGVGNFFSKALSVHKEYWVNALLSGINTQAVKMMSDCINTVVFPAERAIGGLFMRSPQEIQNGAKMYLHLAHSALDVINLDKISQAITPKVGSTLGTAGKALLNETGNALEGHAPQFAITGENFGFNSGWTKDAVDYLGKLIRLPQRMLATTDTLMQTLNYRAYLRSEGFDTAMQKGLKDPNEIAQFVADHIVSGYGENGEALNASALRYAKSSSFQDDLIKGTLGHWVQQGVIDHPGLHLLMPFVKTPTNIFRRFVQMTPGINFLQTQYRQMWNAADPAIRAQARGRMALGGSLWMTAIAMAQSGRLTGGGPSNPNEKNALLQSGWRPYSIVMTGDDGQKTYVDFRRFEPFAYMMGLAADFAQVGGQLQGEEHESMAQAMTYALAHNLSSKTYFNGISELVNVLSQPDKNVQRWLNMRAGAYVPALIAKGNDDDYMREASTMMDAIKRRLPGFSEGLPPVRNMFGEPVQPPAGYLPFGMGGQGAMAREMSPAAMSTSVNDNVKQELARLQYGFSKAPKTYQGFNLEQFQNKAGNQNAYDRFQELHGQVQIGGQTMSQALSRLIGSSRYQNMPQPEGHGDSTNPRIMAVQKIIADYRDSALQQTLKEYPAIRQAQRIYMQQAHAAARQ